MAPPASRLTKETRLRWQIQIVQVVYRAEVARLARSSAVAADRRVAAVNELKERSLALLEGVRTALDGTQPSHEELLNAVSELEQEIRG
jgi:hypothetical protein